MTETPVRRMVIRFCTDRGMHFREVLTLGDAVTFDVCGRKIVFTAAEIAEASTVDALHALVETKIKAVMP